MWCPALIMFIMCSERAYINVCPVSVCLCMCECIMYHDVIYKRIAASEVCNGKFIINKVNILIADNMHALY